MTNAKKRKALKAAGWQFGRVQDPLKLQDADMAIQIIRCLVALAADRKKIGREIAA